MGTTRQMSVLKTSVIILSVTVILASGQAPDTTWTKMYGTTGPFEWFQSVEQLPDSGYILCGSWDGDVLLMKTDPLGDSLWTKVYGEAGDDCGFCVTQTDDGGYIIIGLRATACGDLWLLKTDAMGDTVWTKTYGGPQDDIGFWIEPGEDGGYIACGQTESLGGLFGTWLLKTDSLGDTVWTKIYPDLSASPGRRFMQLSDGGFIITTNILFGTNWDAYVIRTNAQGDTLWAQAYGGQFNETVTSFVPTDDGGYLLAGYIGFPAATPDGWLLKIDSLGNMQWTQVYGGPGYEEYRSICTSLDGAYVLCGVKSPSPMGFVDVWLMKVDENGDSLWARTWGEGQADQASDVKLCYDGGYILAGSALLAGSYDDAWLLKTEPETGIEENNQQICGDAWLEIYPNPFTQSTQIRCMIHDPRYTMKEGNKNISESTKDELQYHKPELRIYDATGRMVKSFNLESCIMNRVSSISWDGTDQAHRQLGNGVYLLELRTNRLRLISKLICVE